MNSKQSVFGIVAVILLAFGMGGCSSANLTKQADINDQAAEIAERSATDLSGILAKYPEGTIEDGQLVDLIRGVLPESQEAKFDRLIALGGDVRQTAELLADELPEIAATFRAEATQLRADAAANQNKWDNTVDSITSAAKSFGGVVGLIGGIAGVWFKRGKDKATATANAADFAVRDLVSSLEAAKAASPDMRTAFANGGGVAMRASLSPDTQAIIKAIRETM